MQILNHTQDDRYILSQASQLKLEHGLLQASKRFEFVEWNAGDFIKRNYMCVFNNPETHFLSYAHAYIHLIPIVFVTQKQCKTFFSANLETPIFKYRDIEIPEDKLYVPGITKTNLLNRVDSERFVFEPKKLDVWGVYKIQDGPVIFIWVDKIYDYAKNKFSEQLKKYYELHVCQTILHEVMHALMDIEIWGRYQLIQNHNGCHQKAMYDLKEESLAEAGSIALMKNFWSSNDLNYLLDFIDAKENNGLFQYALGAKLYRTGISLIDLSVNKWVEFKRSNTQDHNGCILSSFVHFINMREFLDWIKYVTSNPRYSLQILKDFEMKMFW